MAIKIDAEGEETWRKIVDNKNIEILNKAIETRDGGYILMGSSIPKNTKDQNNANFYVVKLLDEDKPEEVIGDLEAFPNPTLDYTAIVIGEPYNTGTCTIVDLMGRVLKKVPLNGNREIPVSLINYSDGVYIINVKTDNSDNSVKVIKTSTH